MAPRLIIVEHGPVSKESSCLRALEAGACCEWQTWEDFRPEMLLRTQAQLLVAHAVPGTEKTIWFFEWLKKNPIPIPTVAIVPEVPGHGSLQNISEVIDDFILWPVRFEELSLRLARILGRRPDESELARHAIEKEMGLAMLVGRHASFQRAVQQTPLFARSPMPVFISGETGTGKELFARALHFFSSRQNGPFVPVDCGTLPEHLAENELFGHTRGAFTDAYSEQKGLAAMAEGGTLFLDEVDALSLANQAKLLRFLQEGTFRALGADRFSRADVRIIAATNRDIEECVRQRQFRSDLYFRLNVLRLQLPALRERAGDVSLLAQHFLENECAAGKSEGKFFSTAALRKLESYHWPGNVRELFNTVQRAFVCCLGRQILPTHILLPSDGICGEKLHAAGDGFRIAKQSAIENFERSYIEELLARHQGNITQAAREAGKDRRAMGRLVKKYGLNLRAG